MNYDAKIDTAGEGGDSAEFNPLVENDEEDRLSRKRIWIVVAISSLLLVALWFFLRFSGSGELSTTAASQAPAVSVAVAGKANVSGVVNATGTLAARRELPVGSVGEGGQVERVLVEPGEWVKAGQVLAVIDRSVQTQQQASLAAQILVAEADERLAQANLERALKLVDRGFISKADVDRLTATRDAAAARVRVARAQLGEMQARTRRLNILAPAAGLVLERNIEPGQVVGSSSGVLFRIAKGGEMELLAKLGEDDLAKVSTGVRAEVTPVGSGQSYSGQVWQVSPVIDPQSRQGEARIALSYAPGLRPGGFASADISVGTLVAPRLPESAILSDAKGSYVYVIDKDNKARRRAVKTGWITADGIVIAEGLSGNERVVLRAGAFLSDGETVKPKPAKPAKES
ncbi:MAG: efflux RND transporter periplasmic adaptor subunit [Novosphingobium sp.]|nr:efflux RND transporter periplasmic adaptor subunit [Novosphingobium sp.]